jgi:hypothetical protein
MEFNDETTVETQTDASQLNAAVVDTASSNVAPEAMTLDELNSTLGKDFKDKASALNSIRELNKFVGKKKEDILAEAGLGTANFAKELAELKENQFYSQNPDLKEYRGLISKLGSNPEQVVQTAEFKGIFEKAKGYDDTVKLKTVLESNPRLSASKDNLTKAKEAMSTGNVAQAETHALKAVLEAYEL